MRALFAVALIVSTSLVSAEQIPVPADPDQRGRGLHDKPPKSPKSPKSPKRSRSRSATKSPFQIKKARESIDLECCGVTGTISKLLDQCLTELLKAEQYVVEIYLQPAAQAFNSVEGQDAIDVGQMSDLVTAALNEDDTWETVEVARFPQLVYECGDIIFSDEADLATCVEDYDALVQVASYLMDPSTAPNTDMDYFSCENEATFSTVCVPADGTECDYSQGTGAGLITADGIIASGACEPVDLGACTTTSGSGTWASGDCRLDNDSCTYTQPDSGDMGAGAYQTGVCQAVEGGACTVTGAGAGFWASGICRADGASCNYTQPDSGDMGAGAYQTGVCQAVEGGACTVTGIGAGFWASGICRADGQSCTYSFSIFSGAGAYQTGVCQAVEGGACTIAGAGAGTWAASICVAAPAPATCNL